MQEGRKKVPVEVDGVKHECDEFKNSVKSARAVEINDIDPDILAQYQANLNASLAKKKKSDSKKNK